MQETVVFGLTIILVSVLIVLAKKPARYIPAESAIILEYPKVVSLVFPLFLSIFPTGLFFWLMLKTGIHSSGDLWGYTGTYIFFISLGIFFYMKMKKEKIMATPDGVFADVLFHPSRSFLWPEVQRIKYSTNGKQLILESRDKRKIKISRFMQGFNEFCMLTAQYLPQEICGDELEKATNDSYFM